jgi:hypothetical protein
MGILTQAEIINIAQPHGPDDPRQLPTSRNFTHPGSVETGLNREAQITPTLTVAVLLPPIAIGNGV